MTHQFHNLGRQAFGGLVDDDEIGVPHQGAAQREHLLLATRHHTGFGVLALFQAREHGVHVVKRPPALLAARFLPQQQILVHGELGEDVTVFRHIADTQVGHFKRLVALNVLPFPLDDALAIDQAHDGLGRGRAA